MHCDKFVYKCMSSIICTTLFFVTLATIICVDKCVWGCYYSSSSAFTNQEKQYSYRIVVSCGLYLYTTTILSWIYYIAIAIANYAVRYTFINVYVISKVCMLASSSYTKIVLHACEPI